MHISGRWTTPDTGWLKLNTKDSYNRSNSGMGTSRMLRDQNGTWVVGFSSFVGQGDAYLVVLLVVIRGLA